MPAYTLNESIQRLTENAIESIGNVPLIIIDNASPQGGGYLRSKSDIYVRNKENLGFGKAVNQGIRLSRTRYVAIVSTDVRLSPNWKEVALESFDKNTFSVHFRMTDYDVPFVYGNALVRTGKERWCTAATFVLDKEKEIFFDEEFFNSFEDYDLFFRVRQAGYETVYTDKACFQHHHSFTQRFTGFKNTDKNKELFKKKHGEYADVFFAQEFPEQMAIDYRKGFDI